MPDLKTGKDCCGCTACASVCGKKAITMVPDSLGFKYPKVDLEKCVECGMCEKVCSFNDNYSTPDNFEKPIPYGVRLKDINEVMKSRSGGAFVAFSNWILEKGGVVYGVGYKEHFVVAHKRATTPEERDEFRGSKYVQSDLDGIFPMVRDDLKSGKWVMFSGTGCQVAGLKAYLPKPLQEKLVTVDIVCHGVPSPRFWKDYLDYIEKKEGKRVVSVDFRNKKDFGWKDHKETFYFKDSSLTTTTFTYIFYKHIMQRPSCGICHFCNLRRTGDLTLADFWGWEKTNNSLNNDNKGLSLILCSSQKGKQLFEEVNSNFNLFTPELEDCMQGHLREPSDPNKKWIEFQKDYEKRGFPYIIKEYGNISLKYKVKVALYYFIKKGKGTIRRLNRILK